MSQSNQDGFGDGIYGQRYIIGKAPVLSGLDGELNYTENDGKKIIDSSISISDEDSGYLEGATIQITNNYKKNQDVLSFTNTGIITGSWDQESGRLTLTGHATLSEYETALEQVMYENTSESPDTANRTLTWKVDDGDIGSGRGLSG